MNRAAYASKQVRGDVRGDRETLSGSALPAPPDYAIPLPIRKYTTTNPNTLSPTYHLLYDLTQPPSPSSIPVDSPRYNTNPTAPGGKPSFFGPPRHQDMKRSTESDGATLRDGTCARVLQSRLNCSEAVRINEPMSDRLIETFTKAHKELISFNENNHSNGADVTDNFNCSSSKGSGVSHVTRDKHQQAEVNKDRREVDTKTHSRTVWTESTTNISAPFKPRKTAGSVLSPQSGADEREKTSAGFNERRVGFPLTPYSASVTDKPVVDSDVLQCNQVTGNSALYNASCIEIQLSDITQVSDQSVFFSSSEQVVVCDHSKDLYDLQSSTDIPSETSEPGKHSNNLHKRAIFKRDGDSVRLFLVNDDKEFNDDSGVASDNETPPFLETIQGKHSVENRKQSLSNNFSKLPSFLRVSLRGKSKKNNNSPKNSITSNAKSTSAPNLIQINNFSNNRSKKNQLNRWHNLQLNSSVVGHSADSQCVRTKGESNTPLPADRRVINTPTVSRDLSFHPSVDREGSSGKEALDSGNVTRSPEIKGILVNKENVSRDKIGHVHKVNTVQFIDHRPKPTDQNRHVSSKTTGLSKEVIDRSKYIIKPREIVDGVSLDSNSYDGSTQSLSLQSVDSHQQLNDQSAKRSFVPQDSVSSGQNKWPREHLTSTAHSGHSLDNINFTESPFDITQTGRLLDCNISLQRSTQDQSNHLVLHRTVQDTQRAQPCTQPCKLCSNVDICHTTNQQTVIAAGPGSDNYTKLWETSREVGRENKITPRQKFERRHNRALDKPDARISSSGHEVRVNGPKKVNRSGQLYDHKESPRARFERDRAARAHAIAAGSHSSTHSHPSDSDRRIDSNYLLGSSDLENLRETSVPPPLPPRVRYVSNTIEKSTNVDINSNIVNRTVNDPYSCEINCDIKGANAYSIDQSKSQLSNNGVKFVSKDLANQDKSTTLYNTADRLIHPDLRSVNPLQTSVQQNLQTSSQHSTVTQYPFNVSDIVSQNEYIRQVLNQTTAQQIRLLFGPELHEDLASLTSHSSSHCDYSTSSDTHAQSENALADSVPVTIADNPRVPRFVNSVKPISTHQNDSLTQLISSNSQTKVNAQEDFKNERSESETKTSIEGNESLETTSRINNTTNKTSNSSNNSTHTSSTVSEPNTLFHTNIKSLILSQAEAEMLASKGIRIYESVDDYVAMVRSPLQKSTSAPQFIWEGSTYIIVPTVLEETRAPVGPANVPILNNKSLTNFMTHRSISDSGAECPVESDSKAAVSDDQATYITMTSPLEKRLNANHRAMSVEVLCTGGTKSFTGLHGNGGPGEEITEPGYVEWRTCSGWAGKADLRPTPENRNSRGYVDWDTIWTPAASDSKNGSRDDEHVYDVIGDDSSLQTFNSQVAPPGDSADPVDAPPALPERTYINRLRHKVTSSHGDTDSQDVAGHADLGSNSSRHAHSGYHCHPSSRRHHHHHNHHHHHQHRHQHQHTTSKPLNKPPPPPPNSRQHYSRDSNLSPPTPSAQHESHESPDLNYNYAEVNKLKGYTFSNLMQSPDTPPKPHRPDPSAVSSENYCRLAPVTSADSMASWQSGDVLDFIDGLHDSMSAKRRENIYILLSNKKTRAKFSESLEIESRLLSRGLILNSSLLSGTERKVVDTGGGSSFTQTGLIKRKGATAPVSSTYV